MIQDLHSYLNNNVPEIRDTYVIDSNTTYEEIIQHVVSENGDIVEIIGMILNCKEIKHDSIESKVRILNKVTSMICESIV